MDNRNLAMLTDFYELTMMYGYYREGKGSEIATFDIFFRQLDESNMCVVAGIEHAIDYVKNIAFTEADLQFLRETNCFDEEFLQYLANYKFSGSIKAMPEGTVVYASEPIMTVTGTIMETQLLESALLNIINYETLIATKARRVCFIAEPAKVLEFGLRRAQSVDASVYGARASVIGGAVSTSNVLSAQMFGMVPRGTHAHSWVMSFDSEYEAFMAYARAYPDNCLLLVDTYDTLKSGVPNAIKVFDYLKTIGHKPVGIRLDSGDLAYLSKRARAMLDASGYSDAMIFASSDIDEYTIQSLKTQGAVIDMYGVGTRMITSYNTPSLGGVYKIANVNIDGIDHPKMKFSDNPIKMTNPGKKTVYRLVGNDDKMAIADLIALESDVIDCSKPMTLTHPTERYKTMQIENFSAIELLVDVMVDGEVVYNFPTLAQAQQHAKDSLAMFWNEYKRLNMPQLYKVDLSDELYNLKMQLIMRGKGNGNQQI